MASAEEPSKTQLLVEAEKTVAFWNPEAPSVALNAKLHHASQFLDEDLFLIKQQIGSTIDAIIERFSAYIWSQGSKILGEAEEAVAAEKNRLATAMASVDISKIDADNEDLKLRLKRFQAKNTLGDDLSLEDIRALTSEIHEHGVTLQTLENLLNVNHRVRVGFDVNSELEAAIQSFDELKLGAVNVSKCGISLPISRARADSITDVSYNKVHLMSVYHGNDAFGDPIYLPHAICALPDSHLVAVLHGEYRISIMSCTSVGPCCVVATYHVQHPTNAPASMPLHSIAADKDKLYMVGDARRNVIVSISFDNKDINSPDRHTVVPKNFARAWSDRGFSGLAVGYKVRWLYTADGDTITAYSLDTGVPTFRRIATLSNSFEPHIMDVFPDGITLVYTSLNDRRKIYWRAFPIAEDTRKNSEIVRTSRHYENHRETVFGGAGVDQSSNLILCDDRSLQVFYRYAVDIPVSTFPLPIAHDELAPTAHVLDPRGIAVLPFSVPVAGAPLDSSTFKESFSSMVVVADCAAHRILMFNISG